MGRRICVTGASGQAGRAVVRELREHGYDVVPTDIAVTKDDRYEGMLRADLTDYGQALETLQGPEATWWPAAAGVPREVRELVEELRGTDAVVHLANIPAPGIAAEDTVMNRPSADLLAEVFPGVELTSEVSEFGTLLAIDRARQVLGYEPRHTWRNHLTADRLGSA